MTSDQELLSNLIDVLGSDDLTERDTESGNMETSRSWQTSTTKNVLCWHEQDDYIANMFGEIIMGLRDLVTDDSTLFILTTAPGYQLHITDEQTWHAPAKEVIGV